MVITIDGCLKDSEEMMVSEGSYSGKTSMSSDTTLSHSTSFSRLSFEFPASSPEHQAALRPHRSLDSPFQAIRRRANLTFRDFSLVRQIGSGDIGRVYLCRLRGAPEEEMLYAMKVVDTEVLAAKKKTRRAETERKIMRLLDHPFLPTLYAEFEASHFSCVVMEYCAGGDLHSLRHKQPRKCFALNSARFYSAEVLVAMEYLHMLGIIYRDLKPENVLVRSDGHIMLTDFDLSLCSVAIPAVGSPDIRPDHRFSPGATYGFRALTAFSRIAGRFSRSRKIQTLAENRLFVAEPIAARSCSFVGTHEYVAPEVAAGGVHGNAVDWWALGIFIYEMIYGRTPFADVNNEATLRNITKRPLAFPSHAPCGASEGHARDLISELLNKDPDRRLGSKRGAADVKVHPFFKGLNFALIRSMKPPGVAGIQRVENAPSHRQAPLFNMF